MIITRYQIGGHQMTEELFTKVARLLNHYIELLDEHSIGDTHKADAEDILAEVKTLMIDKSFVKHIEDEIQTKERQLCSEDLADEILNGKYCVGGSCED